MRSFGTEDRQVTKFIPPRNDVYEYIIFRGSDIKDIHVDDAPKPEMVDPAILSVSGPIPSVSPRCVVFHWSPIISEQ